MNQEETNDAYLADQIGDLLVSKQMIGEFEKGGETLVSLVDKTFGEKSREDSPVTTLLSNTYTNSPGLFQDIVNVLDCEQRYDLLADVFIAWRKRFTTFPHGLDYGNEHLEETTDRLRSAIKHTSRLGEGFLAKVQTIHDNPNRTSEDMKVLDSACHFLSRYGLEKGNKEALLLRLDLEPEQHYLDILKKRYGDEAYQQGSKRYDAAKTAQEVVQNNGGLK